MESHVKIKASQKEMEYLFENDEFISVRLYERTRCRFVQVYPPAQGIGEALERNIYHQKNQGITLLTT